MNYTIIIKVKLQDETMTGVIHRKELERMKKKSRSVLIAFLMILSGCEKTDKQTLIQTEELIVRESAEQNIITSKEDTEYVLTVTVENPGFTYYNDGSVDMNRPSSQIILQEWSEQANDSIDDEKWFSDNFAVMPGSIYEDEYYRYELNGSCRVIVSGLDGKIIGDYDFSNYRYGEEYRQEDFDYIEQRVTHARGRDGILYVATSHNTYAASCAQNAYITAIDMSSGHVIWKTDSLTCNSYNFEIIGDNIVCGYGFTEENDYLKIVDIKSGVILKEIPVASKIDYFILKNNNLYVRTYNTDYCFKVLYDEREVDVSSELTESVHEEVIDQAILYVRSQIARYEKGWSEIGWDAVVEKAKITGLSQVEVGTMALEEGIGMYLLEYRLLTSADEKVLLVGGMSIEEIEGEQWLTEWESIGQPYLLFLQGTEDEGKETWEYICMTCTDTVFVDYGTPEMIETYGDPYTAAAMELYRQHGQ